jgi:1,2-phenylacetyl-CoA epoxidase catalytic subunit
MAGREDQREKLLAQVHAALRSVAEWFGPDDEPGDRALVSAGIKSQANTAIRQAVVDEVSALAESLGLTVSADLPVAFDGWTPENRRIAGGGPDDQILFHLRGTKNEVFKLA